jgi:hypothetical protein
MRTTKATVFLIDRKGQRLSFTASYQRSASIDPKNNKGNREDNDHEEKRISYGVAKNAAIRAASCALGM